MEKNNIPLLTIVRGFPGSGKTTFARKLAEERHAILIEPDELMYECGVYKYTQFKFETAKIACCNIINDIFWANRNMRVVYADVLPKIEDVKLIVAKIPVTSTIEIIDMPKITYEEAKARNVHGVCEEDLKRMFEQWEDWQ